MKDFWTSRTMPRMFLWPEGENASASTPLRRAQNYVRNNRELLRLPLDWESRCQLEVKPTSVGHVVRFNQTQNGLPVWQSGLQINLTDDLRVAKVIQRFHDSVSGLSILPGVSPDECVRSLERLFGWPSGSLSVRTSELVVFPFGDRPRLSFYLQADAGGLATRWAAIADATSAELVAVWSPVLHGDPVGNVFNPNPPVTLHNISQSLKDENDACLPIFEDAYEEVILHDLRVDQDGYHLENANIEMADFSRPYIPPVTTPDGDFRFCRGEDGFEDVMVFHHVDSMLRWLRDPAGLDLGYVLAGWQIEADAHGLNGDANAAAAWGNPPQLEFGDADSCTVAQGADWAEDGEVIFHELARLIQQQQYGVPEDHQAVAMTEGDADFFAAAAFSSEGSTFALDHNICICEWAALGAPPHPCFPLEDVCIRRMQTTKIFPYDFLGGEEHEHENGVMWSHALWKGFSLVPTSMQKSFRRLVVQLHEQLSIDPTFREATEALLFVDEVAYNRQHRGALVDALDEKGFLRDCDYGPMISHTPLADVGHLGARDVYAVIEAPVVPGSVKLFWRVNETSYNEVVMSPAGATTWRGTIPPVSDATGVVYYLEAKGLDDVVGHAPCSAPERNHYVYLAGAPVERRSFAVANGEGTITVPWSISISDVNVFVELDESDREYYTAYVRVTHGGVTALLQEYRGGSYLADVGLYPTWYDDEQDAPHSRRAPLDPLSAFDGMDASGAWTLTVGEESTLSAWQLQITDGVFVGMSDAGLMSAPEARILSVDPLPSSGPCRIRFTVVHRGPVLVRVLDVAGRHVATLVERELLAGDYGIRWDGRRDGRGRASSGVYFLELASGTKRSVRKMLVIR